MFVITNRVVDEKKTGLDVFGKEPNPAGPNELRMVEVTGTRQFKVSVLQDQLKKTEVKALAKKYQLAIDSDQPWYASLRVACELFDRTQNEDKQLLLFVHGYNNDMQDVLKTANEETKIIPGHGPLSNVAELREYRDMLVTVQQTIIPMVRQQKSREEIILAKPTASLDEKWGGGFMKPDIFVGIVYDSMTTAYN